MGGNKFELICYKVFSMKIGLKMALLRKINIWICKNGEVSEVTNV